jgi:quercetin dioxygenase-like cupin family protein
VESSLIYPSLPALVKIAEVLNIEVSSLFQEHESDQNRFIFSTAEAEKVNLPDVAAGTLEARMLIPVDLDARAEPYSIEIPPGRTLQAHFFMHKGEEFGYLLSGELQLKLRQTVYKIGPGDVVYLKTDIPTQWKNSGSVPAKIIWLKIQ